MKSKLFLIPALALILGSCEMNDTHAQKGSTTPGGAKQDRSSMQREDKNNPQSPEKAPNVPGQAPANQPNRSPLALADWDQGASTSNTDEQDNPDGFLSLDNEGTSSWHKNQGAQNTQTQNADTSSWNKNQSSQNVHTQTDVKKGGQADNTGLNVRERNEDSITPTYQSASTDDLETTQKIRQALVKDGELSSNAKNIKIVSANGKITLRGVVNSQQEKQKIESIANKFKGQKQVENLLDVKQ